MRNIQKLVVAGLALAAGASFAAKPAAATPSTLGFYPSTDIYGKGVFHLDVDNYSKDAQNNLFTTSGITYGVGPETSKAGGRTEVGFDYNFTDFGGTKVKFDNRIQFNVKTQLFDDEKGGTRIVAGGWSLGNKAAGALNYGYIAGSKTFTFGRVTVGVAHGFRKAAFAKKSDQTSLQLGYDKMLTKQLQFAADYYSGKGPVSGVQPTLYYYVNDKADFGIGYFRLNNGNIVPRNQVYLCFDYNFDFNKTK